MITSFALSAPESLLLEIAEREFADEQAAAQAKFRKRTNAIMVTHEVAENTQGAFQRDPFDREICRFLYDDGKVAEIPNA